MLGQRGYFGIGVHHAKTPVNIGTLWRSAHNMGAAFIFTIGARYEYQSSDTTKATRCIPLFHYKDIGNFMDNRPKNCLLVAVEQHATAKELATFSHPERAIYLLGAEDNGIPESIISLAQHVVSIDTPMCLNVAVAGSIVMYDRAAKSRKLYAKRVGA